MDALQKRAGAEWPKAQAVIRTISQVVLETGLRYNDVGLGSGMRVVLPLRKTSLVAKLP